MRLLIFVPSTVQVSTWEAGSTVYSHFEVALAMTLALMENDQCFAGRLMLTGAGPGAGQTSAVGAS
ncbi:hypothetical protein EJB05_05303 [Eragrostis curvula]|uniref:Uncharacterized protein n=1 Tax=Eragrostis curvula TaxID=38414 RepID=A0A5J9WEF3_9POAL|nr:hypothetical protein EJB05_05303 [Eragrostis curvula]